MLRTLQSIAQNPKLPAPRKRANVMALHVLGRILLLPLLPRIRRTPPPLGDAPRILLLRMDGIGDFVMTTPLFPALRQAYPQASIDLLCAGGSKNLAELFDAELDEIIQADGLDRLSDLRRLGLRLRSRRYDLVVDLRGDLRYVFLAWLTGAPRRFGFDNSGFDFLLTHPQPAVSSHQVEEIARMAGALGATIPSPEPFLPLRAEHHTFAERWLEERGVHPDEPVIAMHVTHTLRPAKLWASERFTEVAHRLQQRSGAKILLLGGREDRQMAEAFAASLEEPPLLAVGETTPAETAALLQRCRLFLGIDSGTAHIAAAMGCPTLVLFGSTDPFVYRPWGGHCRVLKSPQPCDRRCDQKTCAASHRSCMAAISAEEVFNAAACVMNRPSPTLSLNSTEGSPSCA